MIQEQKIAHIDLLKIDVENSEWLVFRGINENDWKKIKQVIVEVHDNNGRLQKMKKILEDRGFTTHLHQQSWLKGSNLYTLSAVHHSLKKHVFAIHQHSLDYPPFIPANMSEWWKEIDAHLRRFLPDYMIPGQCVFLETLPLTRQGKLDEKALPDPEFRQNEAVDQPPSNACEAKLSVIWENLLGIENIGIHDDFFKIGGDSILSIQLVARLRQKNIHCSVKDIFTYRTIAEIAKHQGKSVVIDAEQGFLTDTFDLHPIQEWFFHENHKNPHHWNQSFLVKVPELDLERLNEAIRQLAAHHDVLRLAFSEGRQHYQKTLPSLCTLDRTTLSEEHVQRVLTRWQSQFDIFQKPLWQIGYITGYPEKSARIYFALHHLIVDTVSWSLLLEDLKTCYQGKTLGRKTSSYRQWGATLQEYGQKHFLEEARYWEQQLAGQPTYAVTDIFSASRVKTVQLNTNHTNQLIHRANQAYHTDINDLLLTALAYALKTWHQKDCSYLTLEGHGREPIKETIDVSHTVGWFTSMYPVKLTLQSTLSKSIQQVKEYLRTIPNKGVGYAVCGKFSSLPNIRFNYLGQLNPAEETDWQIVNEPSGKSVDPDNLTHQLLHINGRVVDGRLRFRIHSRLSEKATDLLAASFKKHLEQITKHCIEKIDNNEKTFTPSDFETVKISQPLLNKLQATYDIAAIYPANSLQQGFIYHAVSQKQDDAYRVQLLIDYHHSLDRQHFQKAWEHAIRTYPILRTCFNWEEDFIQIVTKQGKLYWSEHDISQEVDKEKAIDKLQEQERAKAFDLSQPTLMRLTLIKQAENHYTLLKTEHHSIADGWSSLILLCHVSNIYEKLCRQEQPAVIEETTYLDAQRYYAKNQETVKNYWQKKKQQIKGVNDLNSLLSRRVDLERVRAVDQSKKERLTISQNTYAHLQKLIRQEGVTLNVLLQFAWHKLIQTYTRDEQTIVGTTIAGRNLPIEGIENSVGLYINTLPLIVDWTKETATPKQLQAIHQALTALNSHSHVHLASLQNEGKRLFHSLFVFENYPKQPSNPHTLQPKIRKAIEKLDYPLAITAYEAHDQLHLTLRYAGEYVEKDQAARLLQQMQKVLEQLPKENISLLTEEDYDLTVNQWNHFGHTYPQNQKTLHQLFEAQVTKTPENIAVVCEGGELSYNALNKKANQLARYIREQGKHPLTAMCMERSIDMIVGILGILKAGSAYVPIDPKNPPERTRSILEETQAKLLLTQSHLDQADDRNQDDSNLPQHSQPDDLAYVMYTSGTTGKPKGVLQPHCNVMRLFTSTENFFHFNDQDIWTLFHSYVFDFSVWEMWGALLYGGKLVIPKKTLVRDMDAFYELCRQEKVTVLNQTPTAFYQLMEKVKDKGALPSLKYVIFGGEPLHVERLSDWWTTCENLPPPTLINMYGITETTVHATWQELHANGGNGQSVIGKPLPDLQAYVLDHNLTPLPIGVVGELHIGGAGLARGYLNDCALTKKKFIPNPFEKNSRLYKTGDFAKWLPDGNLAYIGRNDTQIKMRGHRIELGEVESALRQHKNIRDAVAVAKTSDASRLCAYVVPDHTCSDLIRHQARLNALRMQHHTDVYYLLQKFPIFYQNKQEVKFLEEEIFHEKEYFKGQIGLNHQCCIVDIGAHIGAFSIQIALCAHNATIYCIEPIPDTYQILKKNLALYQSQATFYPLNFGLSDRCGESTFSYYPKNTLISGQQCVSQEENKQNVASYLKQQDKELSATDIENILDETMEKKTVTCQMSTFSTLIKEQNIEQIDLLKIDVENSEWMVFMGIDACDWKKIKQVIVEVHDHDGRLQKMKTFLESKDFSLDLHQQTQLQESHLYTLYATHESLDSHTHAIHRDALDYPPFIPKNLSEWREEMDVHLRLFLPDYMVPSHVVPLETFPLTRHGKLDRQALPDPDFQNFSSLYAPPRNAMETQLCDIWQTLLGVEKIGIHDDFFKRGGNSILAIQASHRMSNIFHQPISVAMIFEHKNIFTINHAVSKKTSKQEEREEWEIGPA